MPVLSENPTILPRPTMASDAIQKRASNPGLDDESDGKTGVLKIFGKIGGSKSNRKSGTESLVSPTGSSSSSTGSSITSAQQPSNQGIRNSTSGTKQPLSAREDSRKAVPSLPLPGAASTAAGSLSDNGEASPGRAMVPKKGMEGGDKSLNASTTSLALRKLFLGKPESLTMDDFALWKQFREMEPEFSLEVNATSPYPFLKVAVRHATTRTVFCLAPRFDRFISWRNGTIFWHFHMFLDNIIGSLCFQFDLERKKLAGPWPASASLLIFRA
eukprot:TRINITY_DN2690_c0_g1_i1.p1 TRINITY_DN2690_c0_g1~~TRINITY_DN2690_c0_g1_i1.p1  ORF type:complete len:272 (+),score=14.89 TRINITY_DN2690_c0_g1_i1:157-972(+)